MGGRGAKGGPGPAAPKSNPGNKTAPAPGAPTPGGGGGGGKGSKGPSPSSPGGVKNPQGGGKGGGGGSSSSPEPKNKLWNEVLREKADKRRYTAELLARDIEPVNPRFNENNQDENLERQWNVNCSRCAAAVEMRARGYDVTALPRPKNKTDNRYSDITEHWMTQDVASVSLQYYHSSTSDASLSALETQVEAWPEGARGMVLVQWLGGSGHVFNVEKRNGVAYYIDGQTNQPDKGDSWKAKVKNDGNIALLRTDNLVPKESILKWVRERSSEEINAPLRKEFVEEASRRGYALLSTQRTAFEMGWQDVRSGRGVIQDPYPGDPDLKAIYLSAVEWARRPD